MNDTKLKKQIIEKIKDSTNVLVALSSSPSVDELSAALGLTLAINKIEKHATAIFSGDIPPAIDFLEPEKTFENNVTSLQDFIIALDKEKADHLRYKVDGDMVKIFITPYRTTIDERDLEYSQGDYNVDFVIAIGVTGEQDLDSALSSHGQILSDATVASISLSEDSKLGSINWNDKNASSYSEIMTSLVKDLGDKNLLDEQISTALLTGIVAATDRFSNAKTSSRVMTTAADLMAAGANQQLIAVQLEQADEISASNNDDSPAQANDEPVEPVVEKPKDQVGANGELSINHQFKGDIDEVAEQVAEARQEDAAKEAESKLASQLGGINNPLSLRIPKEPLAPATEAGAYEETPLRGTAQNDTWDQSGPALGGTLNATTEQAADAKRREEEDMKNRTILSHDSGRYLGGEPTYNNPISAAVGKEADEPEVKDIFDAAPTSHSQPMVPPSGGSPALPPLQSPVMATAPPEPALPVVQPQPSPNALPPLPSYTPSAVPPIPTLEQIDEANRAMPSPADALNEVHAAFGAQPPSPAPASQGGLPTLPPMPPMPDFGSLPPLPGAPAPIMEPNPFGSASSTLPSIPNEPLGNTLPPAPVLPDASKADPGQFKIPGQ